MLAWQLESSCSKQSTLDATIPTGNTRHDTAVDILPNGSAQDGLSDSAAGYQRDGSSQNMETADVAMKDHVMKARITESSYRPHDSCGYILQKWTSLSNRMVTPAEAEAAANDKIAVTCNNETAS